MKTNKFKNLWQRTKQNICTGLIITAAAVNCVSFVQTANRVSFHMDAVDLPSNFSNRALYVPASLFRSFILGTTLHTDSAFSAVFRANQTFNNGNACGNSLLYKFLLNNANGTVGSKPFGIIYGVIGLPGAHAGGLFIGSTHAVAGFVRKAFSAPTPTGSACTL